MTVINSPYKRALEIPFFRFFVCFVKKETVKGIIGKTQGVNKAMSPPKKPNKKRVVKSLSSFLLAFSFFYSVLIRLK